MERQYKYVEYFIFYNLRFKDFTKVNKLRNIGIVVFRGIKYKKKCNNKLKFNGEVQGREKKEVKIYYIFIFCNWQLIDII